MRYAREMTNPHASAGTHLDLALAGIQGRRELRLLRASVAALLTLVAVAAVWMIPWVPLGMRPGDYSVATTVTLALLVAVNIVTGAILLHWAPLFTEEPKSELVRAILGEQLAVRGKTRFLNRLRFQCEEGLRGRNKLFSLAVIQLPPVGRGTPEGEGVANGFLREVRQVIRNADILGDSEEQEVWVLLAGAGPQGSQSACARIAAALESGLPVAIGVAPRIGWSAFEVDGRDTETLFRVARQRSAVWGGAGQHRVA
jgi:hypothetical protein